ncbi:MAG: hypothetical protein AAGM46_27560 [Cyanobacteria bacterium J06582_2]
MSPWSSIRHPGWWWITSLLIIITLQASAQHEVVQAEGGGLMEKMATILEHKYTGLLYEMAALMEIKIAASENRLLRQMELKMSETLETTMSSHMGDIFNDLADKIVLKVEQKMSDFKPMSTGHIDGELTSLNEKLTGFQSSVKESMGRHGLLYRTISALDLKTDLLESKVCFKFTVWLPN